MKGIVFNIFEDFLNSVAGPDFFDELLHTVPLSTSDPFIGPGTYPDADLMRLFDAAVARLGLQSPDALRSFGSFLFAKLIEQHAHYAEGHDIRSFLKNIHSVIHVEVHKLYPGAMTPSFSYQDLEGGGLVMSYSSPRQLYSLAEGLILGCADYFNASVTVSLTPSLSDPNGCDIKIEFLS